AECAEVVNERLLGGILGVRRLPRQQVGSPERDALIRVHESLIGDGVASLRLLDEFGFLQWAALHRLFYTVRRSWVPSIIHSRGVPAELSLPRRDPPPRPGSGSSADRPSGPLLRV